MAIGMTVITAAPQSRREDGGVVVDEECPKFILPFSFFDLQLMYNFACFLSRLSSNSPFTVPHHCNVLLRIVL